MLLCPLPVTDRARIEIHQHWNLSVLLSRGGGLFPCQGRETRVWAEASLPLGLLKAKLQKQGAFCWKITIVRQVRCSLWVAVWNASLQNKNAVFLGSSVQRAAWVKATLRAGKAGVGLPDWPYEAAGAYRARLHFKKHLFNSPSNAIDWVSVPFINEWASFWVHIPAFPFLLKRGFSFSLNIFIWALNIVNWKILNSTCGCFIVSKKCINCCFNISSLVQLVKLAVISSFPTAKLNTHKNKSKKLSRRWSLKCYIIYRLQVNPITHPSPRILKTTNLMLPGECRQPHSWTRQGCSQKLEIRHILPCPQWQGSKPKQ